MNKIIDISSHNTVKNLLLALTECDGVILRLGYRGYGNGKLVLDSKFRAYMRSVIESKKPWGVYFVSQAINVQEALDEAVFCIQNLITYNRENMTLGVWFDSEICDTRNKKGRGDNIGRARRTSFCNTFCEKLVKSGYKIAGLYCSDSWFDSHINYEEVTGLKWIARYSVNKPKHACDMWQFTDKGEINGIVGCVDLSYCYFGNVVDCKPAQSFIPSLKGYKGFSIVKGLKSFGYDYSFAYRKTLAESVGIKNYRGTSKQNLQLLNILKSR